MLVRDKETGRFLSKAESEKIIKAKKEAYDKKLQDFYSRDTKKKVEKQKSKVSILMGILIFLLFVLAGLVIAVTLQACEAPRSATMCISNNSWVKCPTGVEPGTDVSDFKRTKVNIK